MHARELAQFGNIQLRMAENAGALAWQNNDPFDRILVAPARRLTFTLATADAAIRTYAENAGAANY